MQQFTLRKLFNIQGIGAASGLICRNQSLFLISDSSGYLFDYHLPTKKLKKTVLIYNEIIENIPKKSKPDFETITPYGEQFYIFGSGSMASRNQMIVVEAHSKKVVSQNDLSALYFEMQQTGKINAKDFNIEGVVYNGKDWHFFQRGNGISGKNGIFTIKQTIFGNHFNVLYKPVELPKINGISATFTDAVLVKNTIYFLATAENSGSVYEDGEILGSLVGGINLENMEVIFTHKISDSNKFEGIALFEEKKNEIVFLLCEDNDTETVQSDIYKLTIRL